MPQLIRTFIAQRTLASSPLEALLDMLLHGSKQFFINLHSNNEQNEAVGG
jgi:hypothetical protein